VDLKVDISIEINGKSFEKCGVIVVQTIDDETSKIILKFS